MGNVFQDEGRKGAQENTEKVHQMVQELEKVGSGWRCLQA